MRSRSRFRSREGCDEPACGGATGAPVHHPPRTGDHPFTAAAGLGGEGVFMGRDASGGAFCFDPWVLYQQGLLDDPNAIVLGTLGQGKSALVKTLLWRMLLFGRRAFVLDVKREYGPLCDAVRITPISLVPGGGVHLNPLSSRPKRCKQECALEPLLRRLGSLRLERADDRVHANSKAGDTAIAGRVARALPQTARVPMTWSGVSAFVARRLVPSVGRRSRSMAPEGQREKPVGTRGGLPSWPNSEAGSCRMPPRFPLRALPGRALVRAMLFASDSSLRVGSAGGVGGSRAARADWSGVASHCRIETGKRAGSPWPLPDHSACGSARGGSLSIPGDGGRGSVDPFRPVALCQ